MSLKWYVVHAYSGFENQVKRSLEERIQRYGMEDKFGEILVPMEEVVEMREGQKKRSERKFFPGYVLVQMDMEDESWHLVKDAPKVLGFFFVGHQIAQHRSKTMKQRLFCSVSKKVLISQDLRFYLSQVKWYV